MEQVSQCHGLHAVPFAVGSARAAMEREVARSDQLRHPSQLYEMVAALGILAALWRRRTNRPHDGFLAWLLVLLYGLARLFLEAFRGDSWLLPGGVRGAQVLALAAVLIALEVMGQAEDAAV